MKRKKLYYVKREVIATSVANALKAQGHVYSVELTDEKYWPEETKKKTGFSSKK